MKLGVLTNLLADVPFAEAAKYFASLGIKAVEIGCGGYPGKAHADPDVLLNDEKALNDFRDVLKKNDLMISAFSCHGNPVHPNKDIAKSYDEQFRKNGRQYDSRFLRLSRRQPEFAVPELGDLRMARRFPCNKGLSMERVPYSVLDRNGGICTRPRRYENRV